VDVPQRIEVGDGAGVTITWGDDRVDRLSAAILRSACPCAACRGVAGAPPGTSVRTVRAVGGYAIAVTFAPDGHAAGIYPFDLLRLLGTEPA